MTGVKLHQNGTLTYWSVYQQSLRSRVRAIPDRELAAMPARDRRRVAAHLRRHANLDVDADGED